MSVEGPDDVISSPVMPEASSDAAEADGGPRRPVRPSALATSILELWA